MNYRFAIGFCGVLACATIVGDASAQSLDRLDIVLQSVPDGPVAFVNDIAISPDEFKDLYVGEVIRISRMTGRQLEDLERIDLALSVLKVLIERELLYQEAQRRNITVSEAELEQNWQQKVEQMKKSLAQNGQQEISEDKVLEIAETTREEARQELRKALVTDKVRNQILEEKKVVVTDEEIQKLFNANKEKMRRPETVHIMHLMARVEKRPDSRRNTGDNMQTALKKVEDARKKILAGSTFEAVAKDFSKDPKRDNIGDLGNLPMSALPPFLADAVSKMKPGDLSGPIESEFGYHLVKLVEVTAGREPTLETVKPDIERLLLAEKGNAAIAQFCSQLPEDRSKIELFLDLDQQINARPDLKDFFMKNPREQAAAP